MHNLTTQQLHGRTSQASREGGGRITSQKSLFPAGLGSQLQLLPFTVLFERHLQSHSRGNIKTWNHTMGWNQPAGCQHNMFVYWYTCIMSFEHKLSRMHPGMSNQNLQRVKPYRVKSKEEKPHSQALQASCLLETQQQDLLGLVIIFNNNYYTRHIKNRCAQTLQQNIANVLEKHWAFFQVPQPVGVDQQEDIWPPVSYTNSQQPHTQLGLACPETPQCTAVTGHLRLKTQAARNTGFPRQGLKVCGISAVNIGFQWYCVTGPHQTLPTWIEALQLCFARSSVTMQQYTLQHAVHTSSTHCSSAVANTTSIMPLNAL